MTADVDVLVKAQAIINDDYIEPVTLLSLDPDIADTGFCIFDVDTRELIDYGTLKSKDYLHMVVQPHLPEKVCKRLAQQYAIHALVYNREPTYLVSEETYKGPNVHTHKVLSRLGGAIDEIGRRHSTLLRSVWAVQASKAAHISTKLKRADRDKALIARFEEHFGVKGNRHEANAGFIGKYALEQLASSIS